MKRLILSLLYSLLIVVAHTQSLVSDHYVAGYFPIASKEWGTTAIYVDPKDHWLIRKSVQRLIKQKMLPSDKLTGKWKTFMWKTIDKPAAGIARALVIAGSERRGTAYGIFDNNPTSCIN